MCPGRFFWAKLKFMLRFYPRARYLTAYRITAYRITAYPLFLPMIAKFLSIIVFLGLALSLNAREFTSADGSKTMEAEFVRYDHDRQKVTLSTGDGRNMVSEASMFSEKDREFFIEAQKEADKKSAISVDTKTKSKNEKKVQGQMMMSYRTSNISFEVLNKSDSEFADMNLHYWVVVERDNRGNETINVTDGSVKLNQVTASSKEEVEGPSITLTLGAASNCDCPRVAEAAARIGRDRIIGTKVEVVDKEGTVVFSDVSSNRVEDYLSKKDEK